MTTYTIDIPDDTTEEVLTQLKKLGVKIRESKLAKLDKLTKEDYQKHFTHRSLVTKRISILFIMVTFTLVCNAQGTVKRDVPLVNESPKIDSLMFSLINIPESQKPPKNDSCILLSLNSNEIERFVYGLHVLNHRKIIFDWGGNLKANPRLGYFYFNGYLIFVLGDSFMNKFITYTDIKKEFTFRKPTADDNLSLITGYMSWAVIYRDGNLYYGVH